MTLNSLIEVLVEIHLIDEGLLLPKDWHQNIFDTNLKLCCIYIAEVLFVPLERQIVLVITAREAIHRIEQRAFARR